MLTEEFVPFVEGFGFENQMKNFPPAGALSKSPSVHRAAPVAGGGGGGGGGSGAMKALSGPVRAVVKAATGGGTGGGGTGGGGGAGGVEAVCKVWDPNNKKLSPTCNPFAADPKTAVTSHAAAPGGMVLVSDVCNNDHVCRIEWCYL